VFVTQIEVGFVIFVVKEMIIQKRKKHPIKMEIFPQSLSLSNQQLVDLFLHKKGQLSETTIQPARQYFFHTLIELILACKLEPSLTVTQTEMTGRVTPHARPSACLD
jgi:hypothetical protein